MLGSESYLSRSSYNSIEVMSCGWKLWSAQNAFEEIRTWLRAFVIRTRVSDLLESDLNSVFYVSVSVSEIVDLVRRACGSTILGKVKVSYFVPGGLHVNRTLTFVTNKPLQTLFHRILKFSHWICETLSHSACINLMSLLNPLRLQ